MALRWWLKKATFFYRIIKNMETTYLFNTISFIIRKQEIWKSHNLSLLNVKRSFTSLFISIMIFHQQQLSKIYKIFQFVTAFFEPLKMDYIYSY